jgi:hypothetical protein
MTAPGPRGGNDGAGHAVPDASMRRAEGARFRRTLASVMLVQVISLLALAWLQWTFGR